MVFHLTTIYYCIAAAAPGVWLHKEGRVLLFFFFCLVFIASIVREFCLQRVVLCSIYGKW